MEFIDRKGTPVTLNGAAASGDEWNTVVIIQPGQGMGVGINPFAGATGEELAQLLHNMCADGLNAADLAELEDQIEAVVPAVIELRDAGHLILSARVIADTATLEGIMQLADDSRLSELSRNRCRALRDRYVLQGVKALLGHH